MTLYETLEKISAIKVRFVADVAVLTLTTQNKFDSCHELQEGKMWHKLNLPAALTTIIHSHWEHDLVGSLLKSCQGLLKLESKLLSKLPASFSWAAFFILAVFSQWETVCLPLGVLPSLNTSFVSTKLQLSRLDNSFKTLFAGLASYGSSIFCLTFSVGLQIFQRSKWKPCLNCEPQNLPRRVHSSGSC